MFTPDGGAQFYRLSPLNAHIVALKPFHGKITIHYSRYCTVAFCYVHKCELSYMCHGLDIELHPHRVKLYRIGCVGSGLVLANALNVIINKKVIRLDSRLLRLCNWSVAANCATLLSCNVRYYCALDPLAILSRLSRFPSLAFGECS